MVSVLVVVAASTILSACTPRPDGPAPVAQQFLADLAKGNTSAAAQLSDRPADAQAALNEAWAGLQAKRLRRLARDRPKNGRTKKQRGDQLRAAE